MKPGRHTTADGSFNRDTGMAMVRGIGLLGIALVLGIVLLQKADSPSRLAAVGATSTTTHAKGAVLPPPIATTSTVPTRAPQTVKVIAANGTDVQGAAGRVNQVLLGAKYNVLSPADATGKVNASVVYFAPGFASEAAAVAQLLQLPPTAAQPMPSPLPVKDVHSADVLVLVGPELAGRLTTATTVAGGATTTTAKKVTTTTAHTASTSSSTTSTTKKP